MLAGPGAQAVQSRRGSEKGNAIGDLSRNLWGSGQERLSRIQRCTGLEKHELDRPDLTQENEHPACVKINGIKA